MAEAAPPLPNPLSPKDEGLLLELEKPGMESAILPHDEAGEDTLEALQSFTAGPPPMSMPLLRAASEPHSTANAANFVKFANLGNSPSSPSSPPKRRPLRTTTAWNPSSPAMTRSGRKPSRLVGRRNTVGAVRLAPQFPQPAPLRSMARGVDPNGIEIDSDGDASPVKRVGTHYPTMAIPRESTFGSSTGGLEDDGDDDEDDDEDDGVDEEEDEERKHTDEDENDDKQEEVEEKAVGKVPTSASPHSRQGDGNEDGEYGDDVDLERSLDRQVSKGRSQCYGSSSIVDGNHPFNENATPPKPKPDWRKTLQVGRMLKCWWAGKWHEATVQSLGDGQVEVKLNCASIGECSQSILVPTDSPDLQPAMADRGMNLLQLRRFAEDCRRHIKETGLRDPRKFVDREQLIPNPGFDSVLDFETAPTWLVVDLFVSPNTRSRRVPFVDTMAERWPDLGGPGTATHFVSHSWGQCFVEDVEALACLGDDAWVWICCFAMTQDPSRLELLDDSEVFAEALTAPTTRWQVLIVDQEASALNRLWVLFEVLRAHEHGKPLCMAPPEAIVKSRLQWSNIQLDNATAAVPADRDYILEQFEKVGLARVNETLMQAVKQCLYFLLRRVKTRYGDRSLEVARAHRYLGTYCVSFDSESHRCVQHYQKALEIMLENHGERHLDVAQAQTDLGSALWCQGRYEEAEALHLKALKLRRELLGTDWHLDIAQCLGDLGLVDERLARFEEAEANHRRALEIRESILGPQHLTVAKSCFNLGTVLCFFDLAEALKFHQRALDIRLKLLGKCDIRTAKSMSNVAQVQWMMGNLEEGEEMFKTALAVHTTQLPRGHPFLAQLYGNLGLLYTDLGRLDEAEKLHRQSLDMRIKSLGMAHPDVAKSYGALGIVMGEQKKFREARDMHRRALAIRIGTYGIWHPEVARSHDHLGSIYCEEGHFHLAEKHHKRALLIRVAVFRTKPCKELVKSHSNLALLWSRQQRKAETRRALERASRSQSLLDESGSFGRRAGRKRASKVWSKVEKIKLHHDNDDNDTNKAHDTMGHANNSSSQGRARANSHEGRGGSGETAQPSALSRTTSAATSMGERIQSLCCQHRPACMAGCFEGFTGAPQNKVSSSESGASATAATRATVAFAPSASVGSASDGNDNEEVGDTSEATILLKLRTMSSLRSRGCG